ncbi:MAG: Trk family potassium uptake protein [Candidatus Omnitrophica bacterium]|nr:Trk family potassium uptake protein [Candidatus Omnitrophota bacterium]
MNNKIIIPFKYRVNELISLLGIKPVQMLVASFVMTILIGAFLLTLPISTKNAQGADFVDALFTATSAACVTGLSVQDTGTFFSFFGQLVILGLIQAGALGIMTFSVSLFLFAGKKISGRETIVMQDILDQHSMAGIIELIGFIARMTVFAELLGTIFLYLGFGPYFPHSFERFYLALFHSVSAFCNAGFSLFSDSIMQYAGDFTINLTISFLIISGGLGFIVIKDLADKYIMGKKSRGLGIKLHSKLVILVSVLLLIFGTVFIFFAEKDALLKNMPLKKQLLISFFQSASARTAGFNSIDIGKLTNASIFSMMVLMFIGASPGSTGGGIKTTTFGVMCSAFFANLRNKDNISMFRKMIPNEIVSKSIAVFVLSLGLVVIFMYLICIFEQMGFRDLLFEVVSAFGTVGLSCGITANLHVQGKILITILMFLGRIGPLTMVLFFSGYKRKINYSYAEEKIMVG